MEKRKYSRELPQHVYCRGLKGNVLFYTLFDRLFYLTAYSCNARRYGIKTTAFIIMPNHAHSQQIAPSFISFFRFNQEVEAIFAKWHNIEYKTTGTVFDRPFGSAPKRVGKLIRANIAYINNNAAVGNIEESLLRYRWNLLAYAKNDHPFSEPIVLSKASKAMIRGVKEVKLMRRLERPLNHAILRKLYKGIRPSEVEQLTDFIIATYNFLDYDMLEAMFNASLPEIVNLMSVNSGSEYDIKEDWDDYLVYVRMSEAVHSLGCGYCFEAMSAAELEAVSCALSHVQGVTKRHLQRFLHLPRE